MGNKTEFNQESELEFSGTLKIHLSMNWNGALQASTPTIFCNIYLVWIKRNDLLLQEENKSWAYLESLETPNHNSYFASRCVAFAFAGAYELRFMDQSKRLHSQILWEWKDSKGICSWSIIVVRYLHSKITYRSWLIIEMARGSWCSRYLGVM